MYLRVKTTIDLPEEILQRATVAAAQKKTTLNALIVTGLEVSLPPTPCELLAVDLAEAFAIGHNTQPVGRLGRDELYDRPVLRGQCAIDQPGCHAYLAA